MKFSTLATLVLITAYIPLAFIDYHHLPYSDGAEHGAAVRALARNLHAPGEPMLNDYSGKSPRFVPSTAVMGLAKRLTGITVLTAIQIFSIVCFLFLLLSIAFFTREYFQDPKQTFWSIACMLFLWGSGWTGANAYMFSALVYTAWYPSLVAFACALMSLAYACRFLRTKGAAQFTGWCFFGAAAFINHPLTASFLWIASALLIIEIKGWRGLIRPWLAAFIGLSITAMILWPYYDFFANAFTISRGSMSGTWDYDLTRTYLYSNIIMRTGPALIAIPIVTMYLLKKKHSMLTMLCLVSLCIYAAGYFLHISLAERFIFAGVFSAQLLVARFACSLWQTVGKGNTSAAHTTGFILLAILIAAGLIGQLYRSFQEYIRPNFIFCAEAPYIHYTDPTAMHKNFARYMHPGDIVFSDVPTSWGIPLFTGAKIVSLFHTPPHVHDNDARKAAVNRFYDPALSNRQRLHILRNFKATKLVMHYPVAGEKVQDQIAAMGLPLIMKNDVVSIYEIPPENEHSRAATIHHE